MQNVVKQAFTEKTASGENITIDNTIEAKMNVSLYGNTKQNGEPTPDTPVEIQSVTGNNKVVVCNKNLLNIEDRTYTNNGISAKAENGTFIINGTPSGSISFLNFSNITLKAGTYTISANNTLKLTNESDFRITNSNYTPIFARLYLSSENAKLTFTLNEDLVNGIVQLRTGTSITYNNFVTKPQLEQGDTATSYVPHKETIYELDLGNIELCKIEDYQDYFKKENGKWYKVENIGSYTFKGNEAFHFADVGTINQRFDIQTSALNISCQQDYKYKLFTHFRTSSSNSGIWGEYYMSRDWVVIKDNDNKMTSLEDFKAWLSANKPTIYYVRTSAIDIEITDTTLINQLDEISQALSKKGTTIISQRNDDLPFNLDVIALTK